MIDKDSNLRPSLWECRSQDIGTTRIHGNACGQQSCKLKKTFYSIKGEIICSMVVQISTFPILGPVICGIILIVIITFTVGIIKIDLSS